MAEHPTAFLIDVDPREADGVMLIDGEPTLVQELGTVVEVNMRISESSDFTLPTDWWGILDL